MGLFIKLAANEDIHQSSNSSTKPFYDSHYDDNWFVKKRINHYCIVLFPKHRVELFFDQKQSALKHKSVDKI